MSAIFLSRRDAMFSLATAALVPAVAAVAASALRVVTEFEGVDPTGAADSTSGLRSAAQSIGPEGGALMFPPGRYRVSDSILLRSGTRVFGQGGATILTAGMTRMAAVVNPAQEFRGAAFGNENFNANRRVDHDITVENLTFDWGNAPGSNSHVLRFVSASGIRIRACRFTGQRYGDAVALIGCDDVAVQDCSAKGFSNCALDAWNGCSRLRFIDNVLVTGRDCTSAININAVTSTGADATSSDFTVSGNQISIVDSEATAIFLATLGHGSVVSTGRITNNTIVGDGRRNGYGIVGRGLGGRFIIADNNLSNLGPAPPIWIDTDFDTRKVMIPPADCIVVNNIIADCKVRTGPIDGRAAVIALTGDGHYCAGNRIVGGEYHWLVWTNGRNVVLGPNLGAAGSRGRYGDDGAHHALVLDADPQTGSWRVGGNLAVEGGIMAPNLPTNPRGLPKGALWNNRGVLQVIP